MKNILLISLLIINIFASSSIRDINSATVLNPKTLHMWQDDSDSKTLELTWQEAIDYCENNVSLGEFNDWRLPNINELNMIVNLSRNSPAIDTIFSNIEAYSGGYWSSTTYMRPDYQHQAWYVDFIQGDIKTKNKSLTLKVRCIRDFN